MEILLQNSFPTVPSHAASPHCQHRGREESEMKQASVLGRENRDRRAKKLQLLCGGVCPLLQQHDSAAWRRRSGPPTAHLPVCWAEGALSGQGRVLGHGHPAVRPSLRTPSRERLPGLHGPSAPHSQQRSEDLCPAFLSHFHVVQGPVWGLLLWHVFPRHLPLLCGSHVVLDSPAA